VNLEAVAAPREPSTYYNGYYHQDVPSKTSPQRLSGTAYQSTETSRCKLNNRGPKSTATRSGNCLQTRYRFAAEHPPFCGRPSGVYQDKRLAYARPRMAYARCRLIALLYSPYLSEPLPQAAPDGSGNDPTGAQPSFRFLHTHPIPRSSPSILGGSSRRHP
jgi:hypothetical protein